MGSWDDDDSIERSRQQARDSWGRLKDRFNQMSEDAKVNEERQRAWKEDLENFISDPHALDGLSEDELEHYRITAKHEIERLRGGKSALENRRREGASQLGDSGWGGVFSAITGLGEQSVSNEIQKNKRLLEKVERKLRTLRVKPSLPPAPPPPPRDVAAELIAELATEHNKMVEALKNNPPELEQDIKRVYGQRMDAIRKKMVP